MNTELVSLSAKIIDEKRQSKSYLSPIIIKQKICASRSLIVVSDEVFEIIMSDSHMMCTDADEPTSHNFLMADCSNANTSSTAKTISPCSSSNEDDSPAAMSIGWRLTNGDIKTVYYVDTQVLGSGRYGFVRKCINRSTGHRCAVKSIRKNNLEVKPGAIASEIMLLQAMRHRFITQLVDVYEDAEFVHIVTDLCTGGELYDKIIEKLSSGRVKHGTFCFDEGEAASIINQILNAVSYMHSKNVVHRDLKPENILFETNDENSPIKIIDFGLARVHTGHTAMNDLVGTPYYIAPEVLRRNYNKSCDLWSVGVIAYILLCGYPPFNGRDNNETHRLILKGLFRYPSEEWDGVSREARDFICRLLKMDPNTRMTTEQALRHPWIIKSLQTSEDRKSGSLEEVIAKAVEIPGKGAISSGPIRNSKPNKRRSWNILSI